MSYPPQGAANPQGYLQGQPAGSSPGYPQGQPGGHPGYPQGQPGGYPPQAGSNPGYPPGQPDGNPGYPPGQPGGNQGYPPGQTGGNQGYPPGQPGGNLGYPPGQPGSNPGYPPAGGPPAGMSVQGGEPPVPSAPPLDKMDTIPGYDSVTFDASGFVVPPSYGPVTDAPPERAPVPSVAAITEQQAKEAMLEHISQHCCYGSGAGKNMHIMDIKPSSAFHYTLDTFGESRSTAWAYEPYNGQAVDGPHNGPAPGPWDLQMVVGQEFKDAKTKMEVPHTASVKPCHECVGIGRVRCNKCVGQGRVKCFHCNGTGRERYHHEGEHRHRDCSQCNNGRKICGQCNASGQTQCKTCKGRTQLKCFIQLTVKWINHYDDYILEETALPDELIRNVTGQIVFEEKLPLVWPVNHFPDHRINTASRQLVDRHRSSFPSEKKLLQRQRVRIVPVTEVFYKWKEQDYTYFVYGFENKVHAPNYPQKCCCGCTIL